ncbi:MAG: hypothetical protein IPM57_04665 [Oligoflexia bacterium]|nr:hypothetical protein [Oligoflexia bacterium]
MPEKINKIKILERATLFCVALFLFPLLLNAQTRLRAVKEAENLTLIQDRAQACSTLLKAYTKTANKAYKKIFKEKLFYFASNFYSEKGFQLYLRGKEHFAKKNYSEAIDSFNEADAYEKSNTEILNFLTLSYLGAGKFSEAQSAIKTVKTINPLSAAHHINQSRLYYAQEEWGQLLEALEAQQKEGFKATQEQAFFKLVAQVKALKADAALKQLEAGLSRFKKYPDIYYFISEYLTGEKKDNAIKEYNQLCKKQNLREKDFLLCKKAK